MFMQIKFSLFMYKIIDIIVLHIPVGVFGLMTNAMATYGTSILGNIFKFILTDYLSAITHTLIVYVPLLLFVAKVNPIKYLKVAFESWLVAFSTCTSMASLSVSMKNAKEKLGIPEETASFVLPFTELLTRFIQQPMQPVTLLWQPVWHPQREPWIVQHRLIRER